MVYDLYIYNTLTKQIEKFEPLTPSRVGFYSCGPTVYNFTHLGHLRTYILYDIIKRVLIFDGYKVKHVMNITDVGHLLSDADEGEDKIEKQAIKEKKSAWDIAEFYTKDFLNNLKQTNIILPDIIAPATKHIDEQIALIKKIEQAGFTYIISDGVYFDTSKLPDYGILNKQNQTEKQATQRIEQSGEKKNISDFALWKFSPKNQTRAMEWDSPWGVGFPGWHIECAAMSMKYLGDYFDIHAGGVDHIPVHHSNEIAEAEAVTGKHLAKYWIHGGFLNFSGEKMSKSKNNFIRLEDLQQYNISPLAVRYSMYLGYYNKTLDFNLDSLYASSTALNNLIEFIKRVLKINQLYVAKKIKIQNNQDSQDALDHYEEAFFRQVHNNFDMPSAIEIVWNLVKEYNKNPMNYNPQKVLDMLYKFDLILGLKLSDITLDTIPQNIEKLAEERWLAKNNQNWEEADRLRIHIQNEGYMIDDFENFYLIKHIDK